MKKILLPIMLVGLMMILAACTETTTNNNVSNSDSNTSIIGEEVEVLTVNDGDTMKVKYEGEERSVRFLLIDAPEMYHKTLGEQPYGKEAQQLNRDILNNADKVTLEFDETGDKEDKYDRLLAYVYADGESVQEQLIESGFVRVGYVYNKQAEYLDDYEEAQEKAKDEDKGIWQYPGYVTDRGFVKAKVPNWSPGKTLPVEGTSSSKSSSEEKNNNTASNSSTNKAGAACTIKGNINAKGNKNYFLQNDANYEQVNEEEMFCSEKEAEAAGFKRAG